MSRVYFVSVGSGDPELLTLRASRLIAEAHVILCSGSRIGPELLEGVSEAVRIEDTDGMPFEKSMERIGAAVMEGKSVVCLRTDTASLDGELFRQMVELEKFQVSYEVVPGVPSWAAAAALLKQEVTLPGIARTVILAGQGDGKAISGQDDLARLARCGATMVVTADLADVGEVAEKLMAGYRRDTPAAVVRGVGRPDPKIFRGQLSEIGALVGKEGRGEEVLIFVGNVLDPVLRTLDRFPGGWGDGGTLPEHP